MCGRNLENNQALGLPALCSSRMLFQLPRAQVHHLHGQGGEAQDALEAGEARGGAGGGTGRAESDRSRVDRFTALAS